MDSPVKGYGRISADDAVSRKGRRGRGGLEESSHARRALRRKLLGAVALFTVIAALGSVFYFYQIPRAARHHTVSDATIVVEMTGPGILDATNKVTITSRIPGFLSSILVDRNDFVTTGQTIAELDANDIQSQLLGAVAEVDATKSSVLEALGNRAKAQAALEKAEKDLARRRSLQPGVVSQADIESLEIAVRQARAEYDRFTAFEERSHAQVRVASAQVDVLQHKRSETQIRAPLNGVVVSRDRSVGDLLTAGVQLFQIVDPKSVVISTRLDESIMGLIESGQTAMLRFTSDPVRLIEAKVLRITRTVDPETREFVVDIVPNDLPRNWALGQRAQVAIHVPLPPSILAIPIEFTARRRGQPGVWRHVDGRAEWTPIEAGAVIGLHVHVVEGISVGDVLLHPRRRYTFELVKIQGPNR